MRLATYNIEWFTHLFDENLEINGMQGGIAGLGF